MRCQAARTPERTGEFEQGGRRGAGLGPPLRGRGSAEGASPAQGGGCFQQELHCGVLFSREWGVGASWWGTKTGAREKSLLRTLLWPAQIVSAWP